MNEADKEIFLSRIEGAEELLTDMQESFLNGRNQEILDVDVNLVSWLIVQAKKVEQQQQEIERLKMPRPIEEWGEDYGDCLWWSFPIVEPPYCGTPLDSDFPDYVTHFTGFVVPVEK
ncbi:hypothetical protein [Cytobacillus praedii]|uniref:hypothetical protein n=1 Tax=Cytobacillus praedii TaxID=1742358 RepID=UPI002E20C575|nr:hypothetical protein [Cytobacillus praedii]